MDTKSLFLTTNADTVYAFGILDLAKGPMVLEMPPGFSAPSTTTWFHWIIDIGLPGADQGEGGKYLILPRATTVRCRKAASTSLALEPPASLWFGRSFLENESDPKPAAETIREITRIYPYEAGGIGTSIAEFLAGKARLGRMTAPQPTVFHEGSGKVMNTIRPTT